MPKLIPGYVYPKGDQHVTLSQETTGELAASMKGDHDGTLTTISVDHDGNLMDYTSAELLEKIMLELRRINIQLALITNYEITEDDA